MEKNILTIEQIKKKFNKKKIKNVNDAMIEIKNISILCKAVKTINLTNEKIMEIIGNKKDAQIMKTFKLYQFIDSDIYMSVIYEYESYSMGKINEITVCLYDKKPYIPNPKENIISLTNISKKGSKFSQTWVN